ETGRDAQPGRGGPARLAEDAEHAPLDRERQAVGAARDERAGAAFANPLHAPGEADLGAERHIRLRARVRAARLAGRGKRADRLELEVRQVELDALPHAAGGAEPRLDPSNAAARAPVEVAGRAVHPGKAVGGVRSVWARRAPIRVQVPEGAL